MPKGCRRWCETRWDLDRPGSLILENEPAGYWCRSKTDPIGQQADHLDPRRQGTLPRTRSHELIDLSPLDGGHPLCPSDRSFWERQAGSPWRTERRFGVRRDPAGWLRRASLCVYARGSADGAKAQCRRQFAVRSSWRPPPTSFTGQGLRQRPSLTWDATARGSACGTDR